MPGKNSTDKHIRTDRANSLIQELLGPILSEYTDKFQGLVSVSRVETSGDRRWAKVWLSVINEDDQKVLTELKSHLYDIQGELNRQIPMKIVPRLQFFIDTSARFAQHLNEVISHLHDEDEPNSQQP